MHTRYILKSVKIWVNSTATCFSYCLYSLRDNCINNSELQALTLTKKFKGCSLKHRMKRMFSVYKMLVPISESQFAPFD